MKAIVILASGGGSIAQALIDSAVPVRAVVTDQPAAGVIARAHQAQIPTHVVPMHGDRNDWNTQLARTCAQYDPTLIVSAGFMRLLGEEFLSQFPQQVINTHPALLPAFPGAHAVRDALAAGVRETGVTVHWVDEGMDTGPIIASRAVPVLAGDTEDVLHERIKVVERELIVETVLGLLA